MTPADKPTSSTLLDRVRDRDEEAWGRLVRLYGPLVDRWAGLRGVRGGDLDDVRQDVFQAVAAGLDRFRRDRPGDTFRGWLRVIANHKIIDHFRRRQKSPEAQGGTDAHLQIQQVADRELPDDTEADLGDLYLRALDMIRGEFEPKTWTAFWRCAVDGEAASEVAAETGVTAAAVRKAKSRVLLRLRQEVGDLLS